VVGEGRFHLVKRLCEAVGLQIQRLFRPEFGGLTVDGLRPGTFRALSPAEVRALKQGVGLAPGEGTPPPRALPKAARRHGHGPPAPPPAPTPRGEPPERQAPAPERPRPERGGPRERSTRPERDAEGGRRGRPRPGGRTAPPRGRGR